VFREKNLGGGREGVIQKTLLDSLHRKGRICLDLGGRNGNAVEKVGSFDGGEGKSQRKKSSKKEKIAPKRHHISFTPKGKGSLRGREGRPYSMVQFADV